MPVIRPYRDGDHAAVHDICIRTADAGQDATGHYDDPGIFPETFAHPYTHLEPDLAFVLDDGGQAVGYVVGTADTATFAHRRRTEWLPLVADRYPALEHEPATPDEHLRHLLHSPELMVIPALADWPAHLHIDLLPPYQGRGHGRALMETEFAALRRAGAKALHVGMLTANTAARPFYDRLGLTELDVPDAGPVTYLGLRL